MEAKSIVEIAQFGVSIIPTAKGRDSKKWGIGIVQSQQISVTKHSVNLIEEYRKYMLNHLYMQRGSARFMDPRARRNKEAIGWEARGQYRDKSLEGPLKAEIALYWPDRRKHDVDNVKGFLDALTGIVWADDGQIEDLRIRKAYDKANPRAELTVLPVADK